MSTFRINKNENNFIIYEWMLSELKLKGNELLIYAIIYNFYANNQEFNRNHAYLANMSNSTKHGVINSIKKLISKGLIKKEEFFINKIKLCKYQIIEEVIL